MSAVEQAIREGSTELEQCNERDRRFINIIEKLGRDGIVTPDVTQGSR